MPPLKVSKGIFRPGITGLAIFGASGGAGWIYHAYWGSHATTERLNPHTFARFTLISKEPVSSTSSIFTLRPTRQTGRVSQAIAESSKRGVWSVQFKQPQLQIARNYTPLPALDEDVQEDELRVLIRREEGGEVSNYLHGLPLESNIAVRGPYTELEIPEDTTDILFLAGGTGIAPALQIASSLKGRRDTSMHIIWANRRREDCVGGVTPDAPRIRHGWMSFLGLPSTDVTHKAPDFHKGATVRSLDAMKSQARPEQLMIDYYVDEEGQLVKPRQILDLVETPASGENNGRRLILVSGPAGFVEFWAGKKDWVGGHEVQGPLAGQLGQMKLHGWQVVKL